MDGDGIGYRTLPGTDHPAAAYFARGSGHNEKSQYSERPDDYENNMERIDRKFETARSFVPRPEIVTAGKSKIGIIAYGTSHWAMVESRDQLQQGVRRRDGLPASAGLSRSRAKCTSSSSSTIGYTSSSRTAMRRC